MENGKAKMGTQAGKVAQKIVDCLVGMVATTLAIAAPLHADILVDNTLKVGEGFSDFAAQGEAKPYISAVGEFENGDLSAGKETFTDEDLWPQRSSRRGERNNTFPSRVYSPLRTVHILPLAMLRISDD